MIPPQTKPSTRVELADRTAACLTSNERVCSSGLSKGSSSEGAWHAGLLQNLACIIMSLGWGAEIQSHLCRALSPEKDGWELWEGLPSRVGLPEILSTCGCDEHPWALGTDEDELA